MTARVHTAQGAAKAALSEVALMRGQVEERIQSYIWQIEAGLSRAVGEAAQQLEKEIRAAALSTLVTSSHNTQALVGTVRDELQDKIDAKHEELQ